MDSTTTQNEPGPVERGFERQVIERMAYWDRLKAKRQSDG